MLYGRLLKIGSLVKTISIGKNVPNVLYALFVRKRMNRLNISYFGVLVLELYGLVVGNHFGFLVNPLLQPISGWKVCYVVIWLKKQIRK